MQVEPQESSGAKASTELNEMRLISVDQLNKIHRELDACQKAIWMAGCRPRGYGFDPAYVTGAQEQLKVIEGLLSQAPNWSNKKPTCAGAYWIRGFRLEKPDARPALVEVAINENGTLVCNINDSNTNDETREWSFVEDLAERFEWFGPLGCLPVEAAGPKLMGMDPAAPHTDHSALWVPKLDGIRVIRSEYLPAQTMTVSSDVFDMLNDKG